MPSFPLRRILKSHRNFYFFFDSLPPSKTIHWKSTVCLLYAYFALYTHKANVSSHWIQWFFFPVSWLSVFCQCINFSGSLGKKNKTKKPAHCVCLKKEQFSIILFLVARGIDNGLLQLMLIELISLFLNSALSINHEARTKAHNCHCRRFQRDGLQGHHGVIAAVPVSAPPWTFPFP